MLGLLGLIGLAVRLAVYRTTWLAPDSDEATGIVMALRASQGHLSLLFWGGDYGGAVMTWVEAPLIRLFGVHLWIPWLADTAATLLSALLLRSIASRYVAPVGASVIGGVFWFFPPLWLYWSGREYVFWLPAILFALLATRCLIGWHEDKKRNFLYGFGVSAGLAIWSYPLVLSLVAPGVLIFLWLERREGANLVRFSGAALVGVSPWAAYFVVHGRSAFTVQTDTESKLAALRDTVGTVLPIAFLGGQKRVGLIWSAPTVPHSALVALGGTLFFGSLLALIVFSAQRNVPMAMCCLAICLWPIVLVAGHVPLGATSFRYGLVVVAPVLLLAGYLLSRLQASLLLAALAVISTISVTGSDTNSFASASPCGGPLGVVQQTLIADGQRSVWGSYWLATDLTVCGYPHIMAAATSVSRDAEARAAAFGAKQSTYVFFADNQLDAQMATWVRSHHVAVHTQEVAGFTIWRFNERVEPKEIGLVGAF